MKINFKNQRNESMYMKMKYLVAATILTGCTTSLLAQTPDDAIRQSYQVPQGTARNMAVGGAGGSLGGDISSAYINPAGIGFYKTGEIVLSPGFNLLNSKYDYRGTNLKDNKSSFIYGPMGIVFGWGDRYNSKKNFAFALSVNQVANFNSLTHYKGFNNVSSWSEQYLEELIRDRAGISSAENDYAFGSSLAYRTFLIDSVNTNGQLTGYRSLVPVATGINQENTVVTRGGIHEINLALASNGNDKFYFGGSIGIPIYSFTKDQTYTETDASGNPNNNFDHFTYTEHYTTRGAGVNLKLGAIYRPVEKIRVGFAFHTPTFANLTDKISSSITTNTENYTTRGTYTESSDRLRDGQPGTSRYNLTTPWKGLISGTYIFNEVSDIRKQKGFITADVEYVRHQGNSYAIIQDGSTEDDQYYKSVNSTIDNNFKGAFNFRVGGEVKFTTIYARAGFAYYGNPYRAEVLKNNRTLGSAGLGYRNKGMFVDLTLVHTIINQTDVPYYLTDVDNTFAQGKNMRDNVMLTVGFKF